MSKKSGGGWSLNKFSFWTLTVIAILELVTMLFHVCGWNAGVAAWLEAIAIAVAICLVAVLAWRYVRNKEVVWKVLYFIVLLIILACIVVPRVV